MAHDLKVSEATGPALDWMVALCEDQATPKGMTSAEVLLYRSVASNAWMYPRTRGIAYCTNWAHGGPILSRLGAENGLQLTTHVTSTGAACGWRASCDFPNGFYFGETALIAAMRCYVASKLGDIVKVPKEMIHGA